MSETNAIPGSLAKVVPVKQPNVCFLASDEVKPKRRLILFLFHDNYDWLIHSNLNFVLHCHKIIFITSCINYSNIFEEFSSIFIFLKIKEYFRNDCHCWCLNQIPLHKNYKSFPICKQLYSQNCTTLRRKKKLFGYMIPKKEYLKIPCK